MQILTLVWDYAAGAAGAAVMRCKVVCWGNVSSSGSRRRVQYLRLCCTNSQVTVGWMVRAEGQCILGPRRGRTGWDLEGWAHPRGVATRRHASSPWSPRGAKADAVCHLAADLRPCNSGGVRPVVVLFVCCLPTGGRLNSTQRLSTEHFSTVWERLSSFLNEWKFKVKSW